MTNKVPVDKKVFDDLLIIRGHGMTVSSLALQPAITYSEKSIRRMLREKRMPFDFALQVAQVLNIPISEVLNTKEETLYNKSTKNHKDKERGDPAVKERNMAIKKLIDAGYTYEEVAAVYNLSRSRIGQIVYMEESNRRHGYRV